MSLTPRSHKEAEEEIHRQHQTHQPEHGFWKKHGFWKNETRNDDTQEKYLYEAAASYIKWRGLHDEGPPHDKCKTIFTMKINKSNLNYAAAKC